MEPRHLIQPNNSTRGHLQQGEVTELAAGLNDVMQEWLVRAVGAETHLLPAP